MGHVLAGLDASHQMGWTGLIARLLDVFGRIDAKSLELDRRAGSMEGICPIFVLLRYIRSIRASG
jgi:hypothetical protein